MARKTVQPISISAAFELVGIGRQGRGVEPWAWHRRGGVTRRRWIEGHDRPGCQDKEGGEEPPPTSASVCRMTRHYTRSPAPGGPTSHHNAPPASAYPPVRPRIRGSMMSLTASPTRFQPSTNRIKVTPG